MSYVFLGQTLHETADRAKKYFAQAYGATHFKQESEINIHLPLKPTWQATLNAGYQLCIEVRETPFSPTLYQFVTVCSQQGMPVRLWVVMPAGSAAPTFNAELKQARELGVGVAEIATDGQVHEFHQPVPLSLFALRKTDPRRVPLPKRETLKAAEDAFLGGAPAQGCQGICQELESITRLFAEYSYNVGWWKGTQKRPKKFFQIDSWASMLVEFDERIDTKPTRAKCPAFSRALVAGARNYTNWRNDVSHRPKTVNALRQRDARLRTMFEATRDLLLEWYVAAKPIKLVT